MIFPGRFEGKVLVVTGAAQGLGEAVATRAAREGGAEAILQLRADYLSDDEPLEDFWQRRQAAATGQRRYRRSA